MTTADIQSLMIRGQISKTESDFLHAMPEQFRAGAWGAYQDWKVNERFNSMIERHKCHHTYMTAFVVATYMTQKEKEDETDKTKEDPEAKEAQEANSSTNPQPQGEDVGPDSSEGSVGQGSSDLH